MSRKFVATVKETGTGQPYVVIEAHEDDGLPDNQVITFDFKAGSDIGAAEEFARMINGGPNGLENVRVTKW